MDALVKIRFHAVRENRTYNAGDVFTGSEIRVQQIVERGYAVVEQPEVEAKPKRTRKPKSENEV